MLRFNRSADYRQLDLAPKWLRFAVRVLPDGHDQRPMFLAALGTGLWMRYERYGEVADINQAIEAGRESVARAAPAERANHLSDLSISLGARYESLGDPADLDEAVRAAEEGDDGPDPGIPANILTNLAGSLCRRYDATGSAVRGEYMAVALLFRSVTGPWNAENCRVAAGADEQRIPRSEAILVDPGRSVG